HKSRSPTRRPPLREVDTSSKLFQAAISAELSFQCYHRAVFITSAKLFSLSWARSQAKDALRLPSGVPLDIAAISPEAEHASDREPSPARSAFDCRGNVESACTPFSVRGCCEPGTARGPVAVSIRAP